MTCINTWWGIRLKQQSFMNGSMNNFKFINIKFIDVQYGIDINDYNQTLNNSNINSVNFVNISNIYFENITGTYTEWAGHLDCDVSLPCTNIIFNNIDLIYNGNGTNQGFTCSDAVYGTATNVTPPLTCLK